MPRARIGALILIILCPYICILRLIKWLSILAFYVYLFHVLVPAFCFIYLSGIFLCITGYFPLGILHNMTFGLSHRILLKCPRIPESPYRIPARTGFGPNSKDMAYPDHIPFGYAVSRKTGYSRAHGFKKALFFFIKGGFCSLFFTN